jgi:hypothetical protein
MASNFVPAQSPAQQEYKKYLRSWWWRWLVRPLRLRVDDHRCRICDNPGRLEVHHRSYRWRGSWRFWREVADTTTLCHDCHGDYHDGD